MMRMLLVLMVGALLSGCVSPKHFQVAPEKVTLDDSYLPEFSIKNPVKIVVRHTNVPTSELICNLNNVYFFHAKLDELTDVAGSALKDMLNRKNVPVNDDAQKTLEIAIIKGFCFPTHFTLHYNTILQVTYNGVTKEVTGSQGTGNYRNYNNSIPHAVHFSVVELLKDKDIISYLNN